MGVHIMRKQPKITSFPRTTVWHRTAAGKWASRTATIEDKRARIEFCVKRGWVCTGGCEE